MNAYSYSTDQIWPPAVAGLVLWNRFCQPFLLSRFLLWTRSPVFSKFWYAGRNRCETVRNFLGKNLFCPNWSHKLIKPKIKFIELWKNLVIFTEFVVMKILYFCCVCANFVFEKYLFPEIWTKMFSSTPIAGYVNQLHIKNMFKISRWDKIKRWSKMFFWGAKYGQKCVASLVREL